MTQPPVDRSPPSPTQSCRKRRPSDSLECHNRGPTIVGPKSRSWSPSRLRSRVDASRKRAQMTEGDQSWQQQQGQGKDARLQSPTGGGGKNQDDCYAGSEAISPTSLPLCFRQEDNEARATSRSTFQTHRDRARSGSRTLPDEVQGEARSIASSRTQTLSRTASRHTTRESSHTSRSPRRHEYERDECEVGLEQRHRRRRARADDYWEGDNDDKRRDRNDWHDEDERYNRPQHQQSEYRHGSFSTPYYDDQHQHHGHVEDRHQRSCSPSLHRGSCDHRRHHCNPDEEYNDNYRQDHQEAPPHAEPDDHSTSRRHRPHSSRSRRHRRHHHHHRDNHYSAPLSGHSKSHQQPILSTSATGGLDALPDPNEPPPPLPLGARPLTRHDLTILGPLLAHYVDIHKGKLLDDMSEREVRGRWKRFVRYWNSGELPEGWYDSEFVAQVLHEAGTGSGVGYGVGDHEEEGKDKTHDEQDNNVAANDIDSNNLPNPATASPPPPSPARSSSAEYGPCPAPRKLSTEDDDDDEDELNDDDLPDLGLADFDDDPPDDPNAPLPSGCGAPLPARPRAALLRSRRKTLRQLRREAIDRAEAAEKAHRRRLYWGREGRRMQRFRELVRQMYGDEALEGVEELNVRGRPKKKAVEGKTEVKKGK